MELYSIFYVDNCSMLITVYHYFFILLLVKRIDELLGPDEPWSPTWLWSSCFIWAFSGSVFFYKYWVAQFVISYFTCEKHNLNSGPRWIKPGYGPVVLVGPNSFSCSNQRPSWHWAILVCRINWQPSLCWAASIGPIEVARNLMVNLVLGLNISKTHFMKGRGC